MLQALDSLHLIHRQLWVYIVKRLANQRHDTHGIDRGPHQQASGESRLSHWQVDLVTDGALEPILAGVSDNSSDGDPALSAVEADAFADGILRGKTVNCHSLIDDCDLHRACVIVVGEHPAPE